MVKKPRVNKTQEALAVEMKARAGVDAQKVLARKIYPLVEGLDCVFDAQTVFLALAGYIKFSLEIEESKLTTSILNIDLAKEKDSKVKSAMLAILALIAEEKAGDAAKLLDMMGNKLSQHLALNALKGPMSQIPAQEFIAD